MRIRLPDGRSTVLTYCTNVHPIEDLAAAREALSRYCGPVRRRLGAPTLSLGLWLSRRAASALKNSPGELERFRRALEEDHLEVVTLNGFPYGDFHAERVKEEVYRPDWSDARRYEYTSDLAHLLAELLPADFSEGTISTLPLGYAPPSGAERTRACAESLSRLAADLERLAERTARVVRVCLEPEPDCLVETTRHAIDFFWGPLRSAGKRLGVSDHALGQHLGLCFDACHQAVQFEDPVEAWRSLQDAGIPVGKVQLSCALEVPAASPPAAKELLAPFDEVRFLHQVRRRPASGVIDGRTDLGHALFGREALARDGDWRVHFHVPLHWRPSEAEGLHTTAADLVRLLPAVLENESQPHLEVETYTWGVLPDHLRPRDDSTLIQGIAREIEFAEREVTRCGAQRATPRSARSDG